MTAAKRPTWSVRAIRASHMDEDGHLQIQSEHSHWVVKRTWRDEQERYCVQHGAAVYSTEDDAWAVAKLFAERNDEALEGEQG